MGTNDQSLKFDVSLSFAGQDRSHASALAQALKNEGIKVFYDRDFSSFLWGKDRQIYEDIYGPATTFVVPFVSKHYPTRDWTQWEFTIARREAATRDYEFILPLKLDDTSLFGMSEDTNYLSLASFSHEEIAKELKEKLLAVSNRKSKKSSPLKPERVKVLNSNARKALGLLVTAPLSMTKSYLENLFPDLNWTKHCREFKKQGLIRPNGNFLEVGERVKRRFVDEQELYLTQWQQSLEKFSGHIDCALFLSLIYCEQGKYKDAAVTLVEIAQEMEPVWSAGIYAFALEALVDGPAWKQLSSGIRSEVVYGYAKCLSASGDFTGAIEQFQALFRRAKRSKDLDLIGLAILNIGTNYHKLGDVEKAVSWYERAAKHGENVGNSLLVSHAFGNLGQALLETDPESAIQYLNQSLKIKSQTKDIEGQAGTLQVLATAYADFGDFEKAVEYFDKAREISERLGDLHLQALLFNNMGHVYLTFERMQEASNSFQQGLSIANQEGYYDLEIRCTEGLSRIDYTNGKFRKAKKRMNELLELVKHENCFEFEITAHHGLAVVNALLGKKTERSKHFAAAIKLARTHHDHHWLARCLVDRCRPVQDGSFGPPNLKRLYQAAKNEAKFGDNDANGVIWIEYASFCHHEDKYASAIEGCRLALKSFLQGVNSLTRTIEVYEYLYQLQWENGNHDEAIQTLKDLECFANTNELRDSEISARDQRGTCLQFVDRYQEALELHKSAIKDSLKFKVIQQLYISLHNLGECQHHVGDLKSALRTYQKGKALAEQSNDSEELLTMLHGEARVYQTLEEFDRAKEGFNKARALAQKVGNDYEYVRAWESLASVSWLQRRTKTSIRQYKRALQECYEREVEELAERIAINLGRLLNSNGKSHEALEVLIECEGEMNGSEYALDYFILVAELYEQEGELNHARESWIQAYDHAERLGDTDDSIFCSSRLAKIENSIGIVELSVERLETSLTVDLPVEEKSILLTQLVTVLLNGDDDQQTTQAFETAQTHMENHHLYIQLVDLYMLVFDHSWSSQDRAEKLNALKASVMAMVTAVQHLELEDHYETIGQHVLRALTFHPAAPSGQQLKWLEKKLTAWLVAESGEQSDLINIFNWPVRIATRLHPFLQNPVKLNQELDKITKVIFEENEVFD